MGLYTVLGFIVLVASLMAVDEGIRIRGFHLGMCGLHKVHTMGLGKTPIQSLADIDSLFPDMSREQKLRVAVPLNVNENLEATGYGGVWVDPCEGTRYGCVDGRPTMLYIPGAAATDAVSYAGPAALLARTANASVLVCQWSEDGVLAQKCYDEAVAKAGAGGFVVVASAEGVATALSLHSSGRQAARGLWLITPQAPLSALPKEAAAALPPTLVSFASDEKLAASIAEQLPKAEKDEALDYDHVTPLEFPLLADWIPRGLVSLGTAKKFFAETLAGSQ